MNAEPVKTYLVGIRATQDLEEAKKWAQQDITEEVVWVCPGCGTKYDNESSADECCTYEALLRQRASWAEVVLAHQKDLEYCKEQLSIIDAKLEKRLIRKVQEHLAVVEGAQ